MESVSPSRATVSVKRIEALRRPVESALAAGVAVVGHSGLDRVAGLVAPPERHPQACFHERDVFPGEAGFVYVAFAIDLFSPASPDRPCVSTRWGTRTGQAMPSSSDAHTGPQLSADPSHRVPAAATGQ